MVNPSIIQRSAARSLYCVALFAATALISACGGNQEAEERETPAPAEETTSESPAGNPAGTSPAGLGLTATATIDGTTVRLNGFAKGSGMIAPDMATMLAYIFTDAALPADVLQALLSAATVPSLSIPRTRVTLKRSAASAIAPEFNVRACGSLAAA